jgi:hypothetical protein
MSKRAAGYKGESASVKTGAGVSHSKRSVKSADARSQKDFGDVGGHSGDGLMGQKVKSGTGGGGGKAHHAAPKSQANIKPPNAHAHDSFSGVGGDPKCTNEY